MKFKFINIVIRKWDAVKTQVELSWFKVVLSKKNIASDSFEWQKYYNSTSNTTNNNILMPSIAKMTKC